VSYTDSAVTVARVLEIMTAQERLAATGPWAETGRSLIEQTVRQALHPGDPVPAGPPTGHVRHDALRELLYIAEDAATRRLWQRRRIVYDLDPGLWAELGDTERDTAIPAKLFAALPHPDPFIVLPEPLVIPLNGTEQQRIPGFFVTGRTTPAIRTGGVGRTTQTSTHDEYALPGLVALIIPGYMEDRSGRAKMAPAADVQDMIVNRATLRNHEDRDMTVGEMVDAIRSNFDLYHKEDPGHFERAVAPAITRAVSALIYLCSVNRDLRPLPSRPAGRRRNPSQPKPPQVIAVGHQVGAALRAWRRTEADAAAAAPTGRTVRPHVRRSHFHTYRIGPGRSESIVKWLAPIPINITGDADTTTVIPVRNPA
jgi:hypothetical protein